MPFVLITALPLFLLPLGLVLLSSAGLGQFVVPPFPPLPPPLPTSSSEISTKLRPLFKVSRRWEEEFQA